VRDFQNQQISLAEFNRGMGNNVWMGGGVVLRY